MKTEDTHVHIFLLSNIIADKMHLHRHIKDIFLYNLIKVKIKYLKIDNNQYIEHEMCMNWHSEPT